MKFTTSCDSTAPNVASPNGSASAGASRTSTPGRRARQASTNGCDGSTAATLAGPAGACAARVLAAAGVDTLVVDRASFPRNKPCGGGISTRALRRFPWLERALGDVDVHRISKLHLEGP